MNSLILLGAIVAVPAVLLLFFRVNAAVVFFGLCAGSVLANQLGGDASLMTSSFIKNGDVNSAVVSVGLTLLPAIFSGLFLRGSIKPSKFLLNLVPSVAAGALTALLVVPQLPQNNYGLTNNSLWSSLEKLEPVVLVGGVIASVLLLALTHQRSKKDKKHKR